MEKVAVEAYDQPQMKLILMMIAIGKLSDDKAASDIAEYWPIREIL